MKKGLEIVFLLVLLSITPIVLAQDQNFKLDIATSEEIYAAGDNIEIKVILLNTDNSPITTEIPITILDAEKRTTMEKAIPTNQFTKIDLGEEASFGYWEIKSEYGGAQAKKLFVIEIQELAKFEIDGDDLIVTNIGNTQYSRTIQIIIGNTISTRTPKLDIGESETYKLVAPEGNYNIEITDGKTSATKSSVQLTGTGKVIGAISEDTNRLGITGGVAPDQENDMALLGFVKKSSFIYIFILVVFGATILLAIEKVILKTRNKKSKKKK